MTCNFFARYTPITESLLQHLYCLENETEVMGLPTDNDFVKTQSNITTAIDILLKKTQPTFWSGSRGSLPTALSVNDVDSKGITPLIAAIDAGNVDRVRALLSLGADPNLPLAEGEKPLLVACFCKNSSIFNLLVSHHATF